MRALTTKRDLVADIREFSGCGGYISKAKIAAYLGRSRNADMSEQLKGCRYIPDGRGNKYLVEDVAQKLIDNMTYQV